MKDKDKEEMRQLIAEEINKAMIRKVLVERGPRKQGDPEKRTVEEEWNVLDWIVSYMPLIEGALRGMQEDVSKTKNKLDKSFKMSEKLAQIIINNEDNLKKVAYISDKYFHELKQIPDSTKEIPYESNTK